MNKSKSGSGFSILLLLVIFAVVALISVAGLLVFKSNSTATPVLKTTYEASKTKYIENFDLASPSLKNALLNTLFDGAKAQCQQAIKDNPDIFNSNSSYIHMDKMIRDDFATAQWCGSGATSILAHLSDGEWKVVSSLGQTPPCSEVDQYKISRDITSTCRDDFSNSIRQVTYP